MCWLGCWRCLLVISCAWRITPGKTYYQRERRGWTASANYDICYFLLRHGFYKVESQAIFHLASTVERKLHMTIDRQIHPDAHRTGRALTILAVVACTQSGVRSETKTTASHAKRCLWMEVGIPEQKRADVDTTLTIAWRLYEVHIWRPARTRLGRALNDSKRCALTCWIQDEWEWLWNGHLFQNSEKYI